jgi:Zn-dependent peptidase ImmA (M78 family)
MARMGVRHKFIRTLVEELLDENDIIQAPVNVEKIAEIYGANVKREPAPDEVSGFLYRDGKPGGTVIGVNENHSKNRQRFTIGHELGHLLLHEGERVHVDRSGYGYDFRFRREIADNNQPPDSDEIEANVFAAELLMPARFLEQDLTEFEATDFLDERLETEILPQLARKYKVSTQALMFRLANLGYVQL